MPIKFQSKDVLDKLEKNADKFRGDLKNAVDRAVKKAEYISKTEFLSGPRPDILAPVTGNLRASVRGTMIEEANTVKGILSAGPLPYAAIHELGGMAGRGRRVYIKPRPYLRPALERVKSDLENEITKVIKELQS